MSERGSGAEQGAAAGISLKHVTFVSLSIAFLFLLAVFILEFFKPRLSVTVMLLPNNTVAISGRLTYGFDPVPNQYVSIEVVDQNGETVWKDFARTLADGSFKSVFTLKQGAGGVFTVHVDSIIASGEAIFHAGG
ncbi:MAG: hypothetical protein QW482_03520 [Thermoproteota archaeon]